VRCGPRASFPPMRRHRKGQDQRHAGKAIITFRAHASAVQERRAKLAESYIESGSNMLQFTVWGAMFRH
jgi:hypothetical protein